MHFRASYFGGSVTDPVDRYLIPQMGQYVTPEALFHGIQAAGYKYTFDQMMKNLSTRRSQQLHQGRPVRDYIVVRPQRPTGLPKNVLSPFMLIPRQGDYEKIVLRDESWAVSCMQHDVRKNAGLTIAGDLFKNFDFAAAFAAHGVAIPPNPYETPQVIAAEPTSPYPPSPWKFDDGGKAEMLSHMQKMRKTGSIMSLVDEYMISHMGEYIHPEDLLAELKVQNYNGTLRDLLMNIQVRSSAQKNKARIPSPYRIVHPAKTMGLPQNTLSPLVLVPTELVAEVESDTSWATLLQRQSNDVIIPDLITFPLSPWQFNDDEKTAMRSDVTNMSLFGKTNLFMIDSAMCALMGEYVHPRRLFENIRAQGYIGTFGDMVNRINVRNTELKIGRRTPMKWLVVRPKKPTDLDARYPVPFVFVPSDYPRLQEILEDESWASQLDDNWWKYTTITPGQIAELNGVLSDARELNEMLKLEECRVQNFMKDFEKRTLAILSEMDDLIRVMDSISLLVTAIVAYVSEIESVADYYDLYGNVVEMDSTPSAQIEPEIQATPAKPLSALELSPQDTMRDQFDEWISKFKGRETIDIEMAAFENGNLPLEELTTERNTRIANPIYAIRDILKILGNTMENFITAEEIVQLLAASDVTPISLDIVKDALDLVIIDSRKLGAFSGTVGDMEHVYTEPFELFHIADCDSQKNRYQLRYIEENKKNNTDFLKRSLSRPDRK